MCSFCCLDFERGYRSKTSRHDDRFVELWELKHKGDIICAWHISVVNRTCCVTLINHFVLDMDVLKLCILRRKLTCKYHPIQCMVLLIQFGQPTDGQWMQIDIRWCGGGKYKSCHTSGKLYTMFLFSLFSSFAMVHVVHDPDTVL